MPDPHYGDETATMLIAGNDEKAKIDATKLAEEFGWDVEDLGRNRTIVSARSFCKFVGKLRFEIQHANPRI